MKKYSFFILAMSFVFPFLGYCAPIRLPQNVYPYNGRVKDNPGDYPFATDMTFLSRADHKITFLQDSFDPSVIKEGDIVYLMDWYLPWFIKNVHPRISATYILVANDTTSTKPAPECRELLYDPKVAGWFSKNFSLTNHPKVSPIPVGQNVIYWSSFNEDNRSFLREFIHQGPFEKQHLIYLSQTVRKDGHRNVIDSLFKDKPYCYYHDRSVPRTTFWEELAESKFVFCPPGIGIDTVRFWEAIMFDTIPVIVHTPLDHLYIGAPLLYVDEWEDVTEELLNEKYIEIHEKIASGELKKDKAFFDYWWNIITDIQAKVRAGTWKGADLESILWDQGSLDILDRIFRISKKYPDNELYVCGDYLGLRPFQIAKEFRYFRNIFLCDKFALPRTREYVTFLSKYTNNTGIFSQHSKIVMFHQDGMENTFKAQKGKPVNTNVFMDLSFYRFEFAKKMGIFYPHLRPEAVICGNMFSDPYVKSELEKFSQQTNQKLQNIQDFWFIIKNNP